MANIITWVILLVICLLAGFLSAFYNFNLNFLVTAVLFVLVFVLLMGRNFYIFNLSSNMKEVEKYVHRYRKRPYLGFLHGILNGEDLEAEKRLMAVKNEQQRLVGEVTLLIHQKQFDLAREKNQKITSQNVRNYNNALLALKEGDWDQFETSRDGVQKPIFKKVLDTEAAFSRGQVEEAERLGGEAISTAKGLQRFILIKSLEREQKNPHRESYF